MNQILKNHKWAILLALVVAVLAAFPPIYFRYHHSDVYQGIELMPDSPWTPRVREVMDGHFNLGSIYYKEGKNDPYLFQPLGSIIVASLGKIFSLDINNTILLFRLFFPALVFLIIYSFVVLFSKNKLAALASSILILLALDLLSRPEYGILKILDGESPRSFLQIARPVNPALTYLFFFSFLLLFWLFYERKQWRWGVLSMIILGLTFYDYFYTWTFLYVWGIILTFIFIALKNWQAVKRIILVFLMGTLLAIPYFLNLYQATLHPNYLEVKQIFGIVDSRAFTFSFLAFFLFIIFLLFFPKDWKERYYFGLALVAAPFLALNQQLLTGKMMQNSHYHWFFHKPLAVIFLLIIFFYWLSQKKWELVKKVSAVSIIVFCIFIGGFVQIVSYISSEIEGERVAIERQRYGQIMDWLNKNTEKEKVVFANDEISHLVVIYTPLNVFYHRAGMYSLSATKERLIDALFAFYRLDGINRDQAREVFFQQRAKIAHSIYGMYYRELAGSHAGIPDEKIQELLQKYQASLSIPTLEFLHKLWQKYQVNYIIWDKQNNPQWNLDQYPFLEKMTEINNIAIYQLK